MNPKDKAEQLVNSFRIVLMNENTECGNEILCTLIAKQNALIAVTEIINSNPHSNLFNFYSDIHSTMQYWIEVKNEIEKL